MRDQETEAGPFNGFGDVVDLAAAAFAAGHHGRLARRFAAAASELVAAVEALGPPRAGRDRAIMRRRADAAGREARRAEVRASETGAALGRAVGAASPAEARTAAVAARRAAESTTKAITATHRHAAVVGRMAAGLAARHEPADGPEPVWGTSWRLLSNLPLGLGDDDIAVPSITTTGVTLLTGLVAHAGWRSPSLLIMSTDDGRGRYVRLRVDGASAFVESVSDHYLESDERLSEEEIEALIRLGFRHPDEEHLNWWCERADAGVREITDLLIATLEQVHHAEGALVTAMQDDAEADDDDPALLDAPPGDLGAAAEALAARLGTWIDGLGVDAIWATIAQPGSPYFAHMGANFDGGLFTEVSGDYYVEPSARLDDEQRGRLRALGWDDPVADLSGGDDIQPRNHTRVWPAPFDLKTACWHVLLTLATVYDFDMDRPIAAILEPFE